MVLDKFFLWVFTFACIGGTAGIILQAPSLYDTRQAVNSHMSPGIPLHPGGRDTRGVSTSEIDPFLQEI